MHSTIPAVPFCPELQPIIDEMAKNPAPPMSEASLRGGPELPFPDSAEAVQGHAVTAQEQLIPGPAGSPDLEVTIFTPTAPATQPRPLLVNFHGGGMIVGHRRWEHARVIELVETHGAIGINVEYRLAPEHPYPAGVEDNYAATVWAAEHAHQLGADPTQLVVMGGSAGGAFAAAVSLMARDRHGPDIAGQLLLCPMVDNTNTTVSSHQYDGLGTWPRDANLLAWKLVLGEELAYSTDAPAYAAPARAQDVSGLPPAFIEVGSAEMFRDEDVEYASRIWATGGAAELHVWSGGFHGFDMYAPDTELSRAALATRDSWLRRIWKEHTW